MSCEPSTTPLHRPGLACALTWTWTCGEPPAPINPRSASEIQLFAMLWITTIRETHPVILRW